MRRLTSSIAAFRADPEHGVPFAPRAVTARRDDEISAAGRELAAMLDRPVHLFLHVKVKENWSEDRGLYQAMGLDFDA